MERKKQKQSTRCQVPPAHTLTLAHTHTYTRTHTLAQDSETRILVLLPLLKCCVTLQNTSPPSEPLVPRALVRFSWFQQGMEGDRVVKSG